MIALVSILISSIAFITAGEAWGLVTLVVVVGGSVVIVIVSMPSVWGRILPYLL